MHVIWEISFRVLLGFVILLILVRVIGNKQLGQLNVFTYISGIVIGSMVGDIILHSDIPFWPSMFGVILWVSFAICVELASLKNIKIREMLDGQPIILVKKGEILREALKKERLNIDDLTMMLRTNQVFSILDVEYAILEPNGDLSVLKTTPKTGVTRQDMQLKSKPVKHMPTTVITDGKVLAKNLKELNINKTWLDDTLRGLSVDNVINVLYAEVQEDGRLHVQMKK